MALTGEVGAAPVQTADRANDSACRVAAEPLIERHSESATVDQPDSGLWRA